MLRPLNYNDKCDVSELEDKFKDGLKRLRIYLQWGTDSVSIHVNSAFRKWSLTSLAYVLLDCVSSDPYSHYLGLNQFANRSCTVRTYEFDYTISFGKKPKKTMASLDAEQSISVDDETTEIIICKQRHMFFTL